MDNNGQHFVPDYVHHVAAIKRKKRDAGKDTVDEFLLFLMMLFTLGAICLVAERKPTPASKIHWLFKYIDFYDKPRGYYASYE
jgi:hypothetical protein